MATTTTIATTLPYFVAFVPSELGVPSATKTTDLGRDKNTVVMYSQNFIPVQANRGLARSVSCNVSIVSLLLRELNSRGGTIL
jgi:hypothetical protein